MVQPRNTSSSSSTQNKTNKDLLQNSLHQIIFIRSGLEYENLNGLNYRHRFGLAQTAATGKRQTLFQTNDFGYVLLNRHLFIWIQPYLYNILHNICMFQHFTSRELPFCRRKAFESGVSIWSSEKFYAIKAVVITWDWFEATAYTLSKRHPIRPR